MLQVENVTFAYGKTTVLRGVSLEVRSGEVIALLGANGAGKTTLVHVISGIHHPQAGRIAWNEREITGVPAHKIVQLGLVQVPEGRQVFPNQSVAVNIRLGSYARRAPNREVARELEEVYALFPRLFERREQLAGTLSGGEQQMVAIARALMAKPRLLILDEPSMGLAPKVVEDIFRVLSGLKDRQISTLLVEQNARLALEMADRGYVLETGKIALTGEAKALASDERVQRAYLGSAAM